MTRFIVDTGVVLRLASEGTKVDHRHQLLAPTLLRSQVLSTVHEAVHRHELTAEEGRDRLASVGKMRIRLLGDGVLRRRAWDIAERLGWPSTYAAEYLALTQLQGDAFVTLDEALARASAEIVPLAPFEALSGVDEPETPGR